MIISFVCFLYLELIESDPVFCFDQFIITGHDNEVILFTEFFVKKQCSSPKPYEI